MFIASTKINNNLKLLLSRDHGIQIISTKFCTKKYSKNLVYFDLEISKYWKSKLRKRINLFLQKDIDKKNLVYDEYINTENKKDIYIYKYKFLSESMKWYNLYIKLYLSRIIKTFYNEKLKYLRKLELNYKLNKFKFEMFVFKRLSDVFIRALFA